MGGCESLVISDVNIQNVEGAGISATSCPNLEVQRVSVVTGGATGITVQSSFGAFINNSIVRGYGARFPAGVGIGLMKSANATVSHGNVSDGLYAGLSGGGDHDSAAYSTYAFNHVHDIGSEGDYDGICDAVAGYHGSSVGSKLPIFITSNIFHNITAYANGGAGVYMDMSSAAYQVSRNLVYAVTGNPIIWNMMAGVMPTESSVPTRIINNVLIADRDNSYYRKKANGTQGRLHFWGQGNPVFVWNGHTSAELERNVIVVSAANSPSRGEWFAGEPCAKAQEESTSCTWAFEDNFKKLNSRSNVWFNMSSPKAGGASTFPGGCNVTGPDSWQKCGSDCACRTLDEWKNANQETASIWADPKLTGPLRLVSEPRALALNIDPLHELASAGTDWHSSQKEVTPYQVVYV